MSVPQSIFIESRLVGRPLLEVLQSAFKLSRKQAFSTLSARQVRICGGVCIDPERRVKLGQHIQLVAQESDGKRIVERNAGIVVRHVDEHLVVVEKPAGMTTVRHADEVEALGKRAKKFLPPTLVDLLPNVLAGKGKPSKSRIRAVHRIDKETSGLVVLARTQEAESNLGKQFRAHSTSRRYFALVRGRAKDARIESHFIPDRGDSRRGSSADGDGQRAVTCVRVIESLGAFALVECELETGRTHQVRIHLGEAGTPLCGERVYDRPLHGKPLPDMSGAKRPMLHAAFLALDHPKSLTRMEWEAKMPKDMSDLLTQLRSSSGL